MIPPWEGAHRSARPTDPCPHTTTGRPSGGAAPGGTTTTPETATSRPSKSREWYRTAQARASGSTGTPAIGVARMSAPGGPGGSGSGTA
jgi:hypothetical protein